MDSRTPSGDTLVSAAEISRLAGVSRAAVTNWRRRHADFPDPVGGERNPLFALAEVQAWLSRQRKGSDASGEVRLWQALRGVYGDDIVRGLADVAEQYTENAPPSLDATLQTVLQEVLAERSPAEVVDDLTERYVNTPSRASSDVSSARVTRAVTHYAGRVRGTVFDPACGIGSLLLGLTVPPATRLAGQDVNPAAARRARARAILAGYASSSIVVGESLRADGWPDLCADLVVCDPPANMPDWGRDDLLDDARWEFGVPTRAEGELAWLQHCYAHVAPGGRAIVVMPPSVAHRKAGRRIRAELVRAGVLTHVVALPAGIATAHSQPVYLWLLTRPRGSAGVDSVQLIDLSANSPDGPLDPKPHQFIDVPVVELLDDDVDLTPSRYVANGAIDHYGQYLDLRDALRSLSGIASLLPPLEPGPGAVDTAIVRVADLAHADLVDIVNGSCRSLSDEVDDDFLNGFLRSAANIRRSTSSSGSFRLDPRSAQLPKLSIEEQRELGAAFRAVKDLERQATLIAELSQRVVALIRDGLTRGTLRPAKSGGARDARS